METKVPALKVNLPNGSYNCVRYDNNTDVYTVTRCILKRLNIEEEAVKAVALRCACSDDVGKSGCSCQWLEPSDNICRLLDFLNCSHQERKLKFELRIRYFQFDLRSWCQAMPKAFGYLYEQVKEDYFACTESNVNFDVALLLGSLILGRFQALPSSSGSGKKGNLRSMKKGLNVALFMPKRFIGGVKAKGISKALQQGLSACGTMSELEYMLEFLEQLLKHHRFDTESYVVESQMSHGSFWGTLEVKELISVSPEGVFLLQNSVLKRTVGFNEIRRVLVNSESTKDRSSSLQVWIELAESEDILVQCRCPMEAQNLASLIKGYLRLKAASAVDNGLYSGYSNLPDAAGCTCAQLTESGIYYELDRKRIQLISLLGGGHFGEVYKGIRDGDCAVVVAVKVCKVETEPAAGDTFLREAHVLGQFSHPHIIRLIGVCSSSPRWIVMEFAEFGELRKYLVSKKSELRNSTLTLFCYQLSSALSYLNEHCYVHRDIAARNVLVCSPEHVKLGDFGLATVASDNSQPLDSKLPVKWMAPESISNRVFHHASDLWMLGVCMWEIMSFGARPFPSVRNQDVLNVLKKGERLLCPDGCLPELYDLMLSIWSYDPESRPGIKYICSVLHEHYLRMVEDEKSGQVPCSTHPSARATSFPLEGHGLLSGMESTSWTHQLSKPHTVQVDFPEKSSFNNLEDISGGSFQSALERQRKEVESDALWLEIEEKNRAFS